MTRSFLSVVVAAVLFGLPSQLCAQPATTQPAASPFTVGVCTHFVQRKGLLPENLRLIVASGATSIRDEVPWHAVEREKGVRVIPERVDEYVSAATQANLETLLVLGYGNPHYGNSAKPKTPDDIQGYVDYCRFVVEHFKGHVRRYEVWNEYNISIGVPNGENGTPANYIRMLEAAAPAIRLADPDAVIIGGVVAPQAFRDGFFEKVNELGLAKHCDAISVHTYNYARGGNGRTPEAWLKLMQDIDATVRKHNDGKSVPLLVTEHGWPTFVPAMPVQVTATTSANQAADYLARMYLLSRTLPVIQGIWWYDFQDDGWNAVDPEDNFGLVRPDLTPKPAYFAFADIASLLTEATFETRVDVGNDNVWVLRFQHPQDGIVLAAWSVDDASATQIVFRGKGVSDTDAVQLKRVGYAAIERGWRHRDWGPGKPTAPIESGVISFVADSTPTLVMAGATEVEVDAAIPRVRQGPTSRPSRQITSPTTTGVP